MKKTGSKYLRSRRGGFTLVEAVFSIAIIGFAVTGLMLLFGTGTKVTVYGNQLTQAVFLADEMRAMTDDVDFNNLLSYDGQVFNGVDAYGTPLPGVNGYQQQLIVTGVNPADMSVAIGTIYMIRVTAVVSHKTTELTRISWLRTW